MLTAFLVPLAVLLFMAVVIIGTGTLLIALAEAKHDYLGVKEPLAVLVALILASAILGGSALAARMGGKS
jgi:hypothetical protein